MPIEALKDAAAKGDLSTSWSANKSAGYSTEVTDGDTPLFLALRFRRTILKMGGYDLQFDKGPSPLFEEPAFGEGAEEASGA